MRSLALRCTSLTALFVLLHLFVYPAIAQESPPGEQGARARDSGSAAIGGAHSRFSLWRTTAFEWRTNPTGGGVSHVADDLLASWRKSWGNLVVVGRKSMDRRYIANIGKANIFADSGATIMGHVVEGNIDSALVAGTNELAKSGVAYVGAKAFGGLGATYGFALAGPPGMMVGGLIGAAGGAAAAVWGYNVTVSGTVIQTLEGWQNEDRKYYRDLAEKNRLEFLARPENRDLERKHLIEQARKNREEFLVLEATKKLELELARDALGSSPDVPRIAAPGADNPDRWKDLEARSKQLAKETPASPADSKEVPPDTIPVIPEVAVIDAVFTISDFSIRWSFYLRNGTVKGIMVPFTSPQADNDVNTVSAGTWKATIDGTIKDNVITGKLRNEPVKFIQKGTDPASPWVRELTYNIGAQNVTVTLLPDGVINLSEEEGTYTIDSLDTAGENTGKTFRVTNHNAAQKLTGIWQYREAEKDAE